MIKTEIEEKNETTLDSLIQDLNIKEEPKLDSNLKKGGIVISTNHFVVPLDIPRMKVEYEPYTEVKKTKETPYLPGSLTAWSTSSVIYAREKKFSIADLRTTTQATDYVILDLKVMRPDKNILATTAQDKTVIWSFTNVCNANLIITFKDEKRYFNILQWHPTKEKILFGVTNDSEISLLDLNVLESISQENIVKLEPATKGYTIIKNPDDVKINSISFSKDSKLFTASTSDGNFSVWETTNFNFLQTYIGTQDGKSAESIIWCGNSKIPELYNYIIIGGPNNSSFYLRRKKGSDFELVQIINLQSKKGNLLNHIELDSSSSFLISGDFYDNSIRVLRLSENNGIYSFDFYKEFETKSTILSFSSLNNDGLLRVFALQPTGFGLYYIPLNELNDNEEKKEVKELVSESPKKSIPVIDKKVTILESPKKQPVKTEQQPVKPVVTSSGSTSDVEQLFLKLEKSISTRMDKIEKNLNLKIEKSVEKAIEKLSGEFDQKITHLNKDLEKISKYFNDGNLQLQIKITQSNQQLENNLKKELAKSLSEIPNQIESLNKVISGISKGVSIQPQQIQQQVKEVPKKIEQEIRSLIQKGNYSDALSKIIREDRQDLLMELLKSTEPNSLFSTINQALVLALILKLSENIDEEIDVRIQWLDIAVLNLSIDDPKISNHVPQILGKVLGFLQTSKSKSNALKKIKLMINSYYLESQAQEEDDEEDQ